MHFFFKSAHRSVERLKKNQSRYGPLPVWSSHYGPPNSHYGPPGLVIMVHLRGF